MKCLFCLFIFFIPYTIYSQDGTGKDDKAFLDSIYNEMDEILDEMLGRKSFVSISLGAGTGFYNFRNATTTQPATEKKLLLSPSVSYLHKSGFGVSANAYVVNTDDGMNAYQFSFTPSYDYISRGKFSTGAAYSHFFTRKDLPFYTTPIQDEVYAYFNYRKPWLQPGIALAYGWGSRTSFEERKIQLLGMRKRRNPTLVTIRNDERVNDFSALFSLRHNFTFEDIFSDRDLIILTPVMVLSAGTQSFGFNTSFQSQSKISSNFLPNNQSVKDTRSFDTQSATAILRADYSLGIFFLQAQMLLDYYLHTADRRFNNAVSLVGGVNF